MGKPVKTPNGLGTYLYNSVTIGQLAAVYNRPNNTAIYHIAGLNWIAKHGINKDGTVKSVIKYDKLSDGSTIVPIYVIGANTAQTRLIDQIINGISQNSEFLQQIRNIGVSNPDGIYINIASSAEIPIGSVGSIGGGTTVNKSDAAGNSKVDLQTDTQLEITLLSKYSDTSDGKILLARHVIHEIFHAFNSHDFYGVPANTASFGSLLQKVEEYEAATPQNRINTAIGQETIGDPTYGPSDRILSSLQQTLGFKASDFATFLADERQVYLSNRESEARSALLTYFENSVAGRVPLIAAGDLVKLVNRGIIKLKSGAPAGSNSPNDYEAVGNQVADRQRAADNRNILKLRTNQLNKLNNVLSKYGVQVSATAASNDEAGYAAVNAAIERAQEDLKAIEKVGKYGELGSSFGATLGHYLGGDPLLNQLVISPVLATIGDNLAEIIANGGLVQSLPSGAVRNVLADFGSELFGELKSAGVGALSTYLTAELVHALGLKGIVAEGFQTIGNTVVSQVINNIISIGEGAHIGVFQDVLNPTAIASAAASFLGSKLADQIITFDPIDWTKFVRINGNFTTTQRTRVQSFFNRLASTPAGALLLQEVQSRSYRDYKLFGYSIPGTGGYSNALTVTGVDKLDGILGGFLPGTSSISINLEKAFSTGSMTHNTDGSADTFEQTMLHELIHYILDDNVGMFKGGTNFKRGALAQAAASQAAYALASGKLTRSSSGQFTSELDVYRLLDEVVRRAAAKKVIDPANVRFIQDGYRSVVGKSAAKGRNLLDPSVITTFTFDNGEIVGLQSVRIANDGSVEMVASTRLVLLKDAQGNFLRDATGQLLPAVDVENFSERLVTYSRLVPGNAAGTYRAVDIDIKIPGNPLAVEFSDAGRIIGQQLGYLIAGNDKVTGVVTSAALQTLGDSLGDVVDGLVSGGSVTVSLPRASPRALRLNLWGRMSDFISTSSTTRVRLRGWRSSAVLSAAIMSPACTSQSYMGISLVPGRAEHEVQELGRRAQVGDKQAQLELGLRYEEGRGVRQDRRRAAKLYQQAAMTSGGTIWLYTPSVGNGTGGRVVPIEQGAKKQGLDEAKKPLLALKISR